SEGADNSQGIVGSQQSQDENLRLKGATVVSNLAIAGGKKVEQFKNWLGEDNAETAALVLMAAAGGPVKTLGSTLWAATPMAGYLQEKKEQYLVNPLTPLIGANAFGALTDSDQQAVQPASHATSSMLVDTLLSSLGVVGTKAGAIGIIKSSDGFSGVVKSAENASQDPTRFINGVKVVDKKTGQLFEGTVDLAPTLNRIKSGGSFPHKNDGSTFKNLGGDLPKKPDGYYTEYVHPTPGVSGPGPQRIVVGKGGEMYYTSDHYKTFIPIKE
ncbi:ribonuclease domain-containing protein, partial [Xanthomonas prunicola]|uniref:ribonuclease domain-containing protein n=3 Tax=Xanthomonas TaxID=338 RepID=UPI00105610AC